MRVYQNIDVELTYQNHGSSWRMILRGKTEDIQAVFNGLWNLGATNGELEFQDHLQTVARFWSSERNMRRFFINQFDIPRAQHKDKRKTQDRSYLTAQFIASQKLNEFRATSHEAFMSYGSQFIPDIYSVGQVGAERPDNDMKDAILDHAFKDPIDKTLQPSGVTFDPAPAEWKFKLNTEPEQEQDEKADLTPQQVTA